MSDVLLARRDELGLLFTNVELWMRLSALREQEGVPPAVTVMRALKAVDLMCDYLAVGHGSNQFAELVGADNGIGRSLSAIWQHKVSDLQDIISLVQRCKTFCRESGLLEGERRLEGVPVVPLYQVSDALIRDRVECIAVVADQLAQLSTQPILNSAGFAVGTFIVLTGSIEVAANIVEALVGIS